MVYFQAVFLQLRIALEQAKPHRAASVPLRYAPQEASGPVGYNVQLLQRSSSSSSSSSSFCWGGDIRPPVTHAGWLVGRELEYSIWLERA